MFTIPKKTQDGRYYVKPVEKKIVQLNGVKIISFQDSTLTLSINESSQKIVSEVDSYILASAKENSELWFQRVVAEKTLEAAYSKSFTDTGVINVTKPGYHKVYKSREIVGDENLVEGTTCDVVLELSGVSFTKKTFGPVWKIIQTRLKDEPKKKYHEEYLFQDTTPTEEVSEDDDLFA
jgi:hypothetical protein